MKIQCVDRLFIYVTTAHTRNFSQQPHHTNNYTSNIDVNKSIGNRQLAIGNRQLTIGNRQCAMCLRQGFGEQAGKR